MIDLDQAAAELTASVAHVEPDLPRIQHAARRRQRRRRTVLAVAAVAVLAAGGAAALAATGDERYAEQVRTGPSPGRGRPKAEDIVDYGNLRITVPEGWVSVTTDVYPEGTCDAQGLILVGPDVVLPEACIGVPGIEVRVGAEVTTGERGQRTSDDGVLSVLVDRNARGDEVWSVPSLNARIETRYGADPRPVIDSVRPSPRLVAVSEATDGTRSSDPLPTDGWATLGMEGVEVRYPASWPRRTAIDDPDRTEEPCREWREAGPSAVAGRVGSSRCEDDRSWVPRDGVWILPLDATSIDAAFPENDQVQIGSTQVTVVWDVRLDVLEVVVPGEGDRPDLLVRIGLGTDAGTAGSILASIRVTGGP